MTEHLTMEHETLSYKCTLHTHWSLLKANGSSPHECDTTQINEATISQDVRLLWNLYTNLYRVYYYSILHKMVLLCK